jgi:hypothetical protein
MRQVIRIVGAAVVAASLTTRPAAAQPPPGAPPPPAPKWWEQSSLAVAPQDKWLTHVQGTIALMHADGNTEGYSVDVRSSFDARYRRVTNRFEFDTGRQDIIYGLGGGQVQSHTHTIRDQVEYDLTRRALLVAGIEGFADTLRFLNGRTSVYGGGGITIAESARQKLAVTGGLGFVHFDYDAEAMIHLNPAIALLPASPSSGAVVVQQSWRIRLPNGITLTQGANLTEYFEAILGKQYGFSISVDIPLGRHVSFVPAWRVRDEGNVYTEALRMKEQDRTLNLGIRFSY